MNEIKGFNYVPANSQICDPGIATGKELFFDNHTIRVPDTLLDKAVRHFLSFEISAKERVNVKDAYKQALQGIYGRAYSDDVLRYWLPSAAMLPCAKWVLMTTYFDDTDLRWESAPGNYTCLGFWKCLQEYAAANTPIKPPNPLDRRVKIAEGLIIPSANEQEKIQASFYVKNDIELAYLSAGCSDILPDNSQIKTVLSNALIVNPRANIYWTLKPLVIMLSSNVSPISPVLPSTAPNISPVETYHPGTTPAVKEDQKKSLLPYVGIGLALILLNKI